MPNTHRWILGTAVVLIVTLGFLTNALLIQTLNELNLTKQQLVSNKTETREPVIPAPTDDAPVPERELFSMDLQNGLRIIGVEQPTEDPATVNNFDIFRIDSKTGTRTLLATRDLSGPGHSVAFEAYEYQPTVRVRTETAWEGFDERYVHYIRRENGSLALTTRYRNGQSVELTRDDKKLEIALSPDGACMDNASEPAKRVNVTGIVANGQEIKFKKPYQVTCLPSEMAGAGFYPEIDVSYYAGDKTAQGEELLYMRLPVPVEVAVDVANLTPEGVRVRDIEGSR